MTDATNISNIKPEYLELLSSIEDEYVRSEANSFIESVELLQLMMAKDRPRVKDMPKGEDGLISPCITNPHILENMDYFRQAAIHFEKHKCYTFAHPNRHPKSQFMQFWKEERRRCIEGYAREDGEWISGYYYWYLNYSVIQLTRELTDEEIEGIKAGENIKVERQTAFPRVWDGDYWFFHYVEAGERAGKHGNVLKTRGRGYSFKCSSMLTRNYYNFPKSKSYAMASDTEYLTSDGLLTKAWDIIDYVDDNTPWRKARDKKDTEMHKKASYVEPDTGIEKGIKTEIIGVTLKDRPGKARGKRGKLILWEESGIFPHLGKSWGIAESSLKQGRAVFGYMVAFGTGGEEGANFETAEDMFYNPGGYDILPLRNVFDETKGQGTCTFYMPEYLNREGCYDKDGNSNVLKALIETLYDRKRIKDGSNDPNLLTQKKAEHPITPQESVMRTEGSLFPIGDLKEYLADISPKMDTFLAPHYIGNLTMKDSGDIIWRPDDSVRIVREFPIRDNKNKIGGIEIFEMPFEGAAGTVPSGMYIAGIDPIDDDESSTNSLFSMFILNTITDRVVAEYTGRPRAAEIAYENARRLLMYYNAVANYENDKKGLFAYFKNKHSLHLLADTPEIVKDMDMGTISRVGNKSKGCNSNKKLNAWGRRLQADWMIEPAYSNDEDENALNLHKIRSVAYLKEAIRWNPDGNFDRVSAMGMLMILREERKKIIVDFSDKTNTLANDKFWDKNYNKNAAWGWRR